MCVSRLRKSEECVGEFQSQIKYRYGYNFLFFLIHIISDVVFSSAVHGAVRSNFVVVSGNFVLLLLLLLLPYCVQLQN